MKHLTAAALLAVLCMGPAYAKDQKAAGVPIPAKALLATVTLGEGVIADQLMVFPLLAPKAESDDAPATEPLGVGADRGTTTISFKEPEMSRRRYDVVATNGGDEPVLVFGGTVLVGGTIDRLIPEDYVIAPGESIDIPALPAASRKDKRDKPAAFALMASIAPVYLRERGLRDASSWAIRNFVSHYEEFIGKDDARRSLAAIDESPTLGEFCSECLGATAQFPAMEGGRVVGFVTAVRGRVHVLELFGSNKLMSTYFPAILRSHVYTAAAIQLRAKKAGIPQIGLDAVPALAKSKVRTQVEAFLKRAKNARYRSDRLMRGVAGKAHVIRTSRENGRSVSIDGRLVHATIFPHEPFERALYGHDLDPSDNPIGDKESERDDPGRNELGNRQGRLSEYERRLLDRLRNRGGGINRPGVGGGGIRGR